MRTALHYGNRSISEIVIGMLVFLLSVSNVYGATVVIASDPFTDGNRNDGTDPLDVAWYAISQSSPPSSPPAMSLSIVNDTVIGFDRALSVDTPSFTLGEGRPQHVIVANFTPVTVGSNIGDRVQLSFDFRLSTNTGPADADGFRFGIGHAGDTRFASDNLASDMLIFTDDHGYIATIGTGGERGIEILRDNIGEGFLGGPGNALLFRDSSADAPSIIDTLRHTLSLTIERAAGSALGVLLAVDGQTGFGIDSSTVRIDTFDEIAISGQVSDLDYTIDNVLIQTTAIRGDIDLDGDVDRTDAARFSQHFGTDSGAIWTTGDFDSDGVTTLRDFGLLQSHLGQSLALSPAAAAVPEPATFVLVLTSGGILFASRSFRHARRRKMHHRDHDTPVDMFSDTLTVTVGP